MAISLNPNQTILNDELLLSQVICRETINRSHYRDEKRGGPEPKGGQTWISRLVVSQLRKQRMVNSGCTHNQKLTETLESGKKVSKSEYVFSEGEKPCRDVKRAWVTALERAGIENFRFHDLSYGWGWRGMIQKRSWK